MTDILETRVRAAEIADRLCARWREDNGGYQWQIAYLSALETMGHDTANEPEPKNRRYF